MKNILQTVHIKASSPKNPSQNFCSSGLVDKLNYALTGDGLESYRLRSMMKSLIIFMKDLERDTALHYLQITSASITVRAVQSNLITPIFASSGSSQHICPKRGSQDNKLQILGLNI